MGDTEPDTSEVPSRRDEDDVSSGLAMRSPPRDCERLRSFSMLWN